MTNTSVAPPREDAPVHWAIRLRAKDGKAASATVVEVTFVPGQVDSPHRHTGPVFGYVLEGEYEHALDDEPVKKYKAGDTFYEPSGCLHRVARNPSGKTRTRLLAVILHSRDTKETTVPEKRARNRNRRS